MRQDRVIQIGGYIKADRNNPQRGRIYDIGG